MRIKLLSGRRVLAVRIDKGEEVIGSLKNACEKYGIKSGVIYGIGAVGNARVIAGGSTEYVKPKEKEFSGPIEIAAAMGNVSQKNGETYIHLHASLGLTDHSAIAGHIASAVISLTGEFFILETEEIKRKFDERVKMYTLDLD